MGTLISRAGSVRTVLTHDSIMMYGATPRETFTTVRNAGIGCVRIDF